MTIVSPLCNRFLLPDQANSSLIKNTDPLYSVGFITEENPETVHSPTLVELQNGNLLAVWNGGSREGGKDVLLYRATFNHATGQWGAVTILTSPEETGSDLKRYIRKVGNPTLVKDISGKIWLFYVTVSIGGWSGSAVNYRISLSSGADFGPAKRLVTTPFFNVSTLVRTTPILYQDGGIGLPIYHEFVGKFGELLRLDPNGTILDKIRMSWGRSTLQPSIVPLSETCAIAFFRHEGGAPKRILTSITADGGQSFRPQTEMEFPNPNASIMGLRLRDGTLLLVFNNSEVNRRNLALAQSTDQGKSWKTVHFFETSSPEDLSDTEFSYPSLIQGADDTIHLLYTWNRKRIRHIRFNPAFLRGL